MTKDYPIDESSELDRSGGFRVNVSAGQDTFAEWTSGGGHDPSEADVVTAHPVHGTLGWLAVVNPGPRTQSTLQDLLATAHLRARARWNRRQASSTG